MMTCERCGSDFVGRSYYLVRAEHLIEFGDRRDTEFKLIARYYCGPCFKAVDHLLESERQRWKGPGL